MIQPIAMLRSYTEVSSAKVMGVAHIFQVEVSWIAQSKGFGISPRTLRSHTMRGPNRLQVSLQTP